MIEYALFDWDNTLRKGFTIKDWVKYLSEKQIVAEDIYVNLLEQFKLFDNRKISYQQLSDNTTYIYAEAVMKKRVSEMEKLGQEFCLQDCMIFSFVSELFGKFRKNNIEIIVISGTPQMLLKHYSKLLGIDEVYGMVIGVEANYYTNIVEKDYGVFKEDIVKEICSAKGRLPIFALGDSVADAPLINSAEYGCYVDKKTGKLSLDGKIIGSIASTCKAIEALGIFQ